MAGHVSPQTPFCKPYVAPDRAQQLPGSPGEADPEKGAQLPIRPQPLGVLPATSYARRAAQYSIAPLRQ